MIIYCLAPHNGFGPLRSFMFLSPFSGVSPPPFPLRPRSEKGTSSQASFPFYDGILRVFMLKPRFLWHFYLFCVNDTFSLIPCLFLYRSIMWTLPLSWCRMPVSPNQRPGLKVMTHPTVFVKCLKWEGREC